MFNQLKSFLSRTFSKQPEARPEAQKPAPAKEAPQAVPVAAKTAPASAPKQKQVAKPTPAAAAPAPAPSAASGSDEIFNLPVKVVLNQFSPSLTALVKSPGDADLALPLKRILSQLPQGAVKLTFGEIRQAAPAGTFLDVTSQDQTVVDLPLPEILSRLSPAHLSRRPAQKTIEVPAEVGNVFGPRGEQLQQASAPAAKAAPAPAPAAPKVAAPAAPALPKPVEAAPKVAAPTLPPPPKPAAPIAAPKIPAPSLPKVEPVAAKPVGNMPAIPQDQTQFFLNKESAAVGEALTVALGSLIDAWPQNIKEEISSSKLGDSSVALPMDRIEAGLKTGKLTFAWGEIAAWLKPNPHTSQLNADTTVDLPLKVIAPLFISQHRPLKAQKKVAIDETIPDVFAGGRAPGAAMAAPSAPAPALPTPPPAPKPSLPTPPPPAPKVPDAIPAANLPKPSIPAPSLPKPPLPLPTKPIPAPPAQKAPAVPAVAAAQEAKTLGELFGEPAKKDWSPREIVQKVNAMPGISGSIVVLQDGLMVAGELAAPFRAETTAAFLPQIFGRMTHYAKELNLGDMGTLVLECEKAPVQVTKAGLVYFAVIGKPGESLPVGQIKLIAAELAKQNK